MKWFIYRKISKVKQEIKNNLENIKTLKNEIKKKDFKISKKNNLYDSEITYSVYLDFIWKK